MAMRVSMNIGFVTNSSSVVYHFPSEVLEHPKVKALLAAFEVGDGFVGDYMWSRSHCTTIAITKEMKQKALDALNAHGFDPEDGVRIPVVNVDSDEVLIIYGDEYENLASMISDFMCEALKEIRKTDEWRGGVIGDEYN